jgi:hypothetical protein
MWVTFSGFFFVPFGVETRGRLKSATCEDRKEREKQLGSLDGEEEFGGTVWRTYLCASVFTIIYNCTPLPLFTLIPLLLRYHHLSLSLSHTTTNNGIRTPPLHENDSDQTQVCQPQQI